MNPKRHKSMIIGSYLGDGYIPKPQLKTGNCYLKVQHGIKQLEYARWKAKLLNAKEPIIVNRTFKGKPYTACTFDTKVNPFCTRLRKLYDKTGHKRLNKVILSYLDELGLAIWYLDDGHLSWRRHRRKDGSVYKYLGGIKISTCSFTDDECQMLIDLLKRKWNLSSKIYWTKGKYPCIWLNSTNTKIFIEIIKPFVPECMFYKIDI